MAVDLGRVLDRFRKTPEQQGKVWKQWEEVQPHRRDGCPNCWGRTFYAGPEGPGAQNHECSRCGCRWNIPFVSGFNWQFIGRDESLKAVAGRIRRNRGLPVGEEQ